MRTEEVLLKISSQELNEVLENLEQLKKKLTYDLTKLKGLLESLENAVEGEIYIRDIEDLRWKTEEYSLILQRINDLIRGMREINSCYESAEISATAGTVLSDLISDNNYDNPFAAVLNSERVDDCPQKDLSHKKNKTTEYSNRKKPSANSRTDVSMEHVNQNEVLTNFSPRGYSDIQNEAPAFSSSAPQDSQDRHNSYNAMSARPSSCKSASKASPVSAILDFIKAPFAIAGSLLTVTGNKRREENELNAQLVESENKIRNKAEQKDICETEKKLTIQSVQFSALAPAKMKKGDYSLIQLLMYEDEYRNVVDRIHSQSENLISETPGGELCLRQQSAIMIRLISPDIKVSGEMLSLEESRIWQGGYQNFTFAVLIPFEYDKRQIIFKADVYINDLIASSLTFITTVNADQEQEQIIKIQRNDIMSAFVSYASKDRARVVAIIQGMKKARPDLDVFMDVDRLLSGELWENALKKEIANRDIFYLCWSISARESRVVEMEWRYALNHRGIEYIEPVPIDPPNICPPPDELSSKHFNDRLLYLIKSSE